MKFLYRILFFSFCFTLIGTTVFAKKQKKSKPKTTQTIKKKKKSNKIDRKKKIDKYPAKADLKNLIKETTNPIEISKSDTLPEKTITILSAFKPQLKNLAKINFSNATVLNDTSNITLSYQVPSQNLSFEYRPIALIPRSLTIDSAILTKNNLNVKVGYGNFLHDVEQLEFTTIDNFNKSHNLIVNNESISGTQHHLQSFRNVNLQYIGNQTLNENNSIQTQFFYVSNQKYRYGLVPDTSILPYSNFEQKINHIGLAIAWSHDEQLLHPLHVNPTLQIDHFQLNNNTNNTNIELNNPTFIQLKNNVILNLDNYINWSQYNPNSNGQQVNKIIRFDPSLRMNIKGFYTNIGASQVWGLNNKFNFYPAVSFIKKLNDTTYTLSSGWRTNVEINNLSKMILFNPWIEAYRILNTMTNEHKYIKIDVNKSKYVSYGFEIATNDYRNLPLFNRLVQNDNKTKGLQYQVIFEPRAITLDLNAHFHYQFSDKITFKNEFHYTQFNLIRDNSKPWGILPLEIKSSFNWYPSRKWNILASGQYWTGAAEYRDISKPFTNKNVLILNAGFTYNLTSNWSMWAKGDNLLDKPYERWADYPSLGLQLTGGVTYSFRK